ncbi:phosphatidylserine decarboxylase family protein [Desulfosporosinus sp. BG]|uniref:phosphatidylserine decarboxylase family protein n=1 Tax=Desulfosporosinus sp. BG TaxID=1633135 RepID=UPI00083A72AD|nr:phosphatidylserine decarboxylase family protein [Desulfosporosinus sp. BG]ODA39387.1 Phosphatidylserine decarboxylase [Desulfosporosinus sp. BG]
MKQYPISRDGWIYLAILAVLAVLAYWAWPWLVILPGIVFLFVAFFFRNPERDIPTDELTLVSPADGVIMDVERVFEDQFLNGESIRVRIFLSVFNVHVNRSPLVGKVVFRAYRPGQMIPAFKSHASELNEKNYVGIQNKQLQVLVTQVTGFIARRIVCWVNIGDIVAKGERFGLIKFGSCTEIFVPTNVAIMVSPGDRVRGGVSVIGRVSVD